MGVGVSVCITGVPSVRAMRDLRSEGQGTDGSNQDRDMALLLTCGCAWSHRACGSSHWGYMKPVIFFKFLIEV